MTTITSIEQLREIYNNPSEASQIKVTKRLTPEYRQMVEASPFMALASSGPEGLDCSPRGDLGGVVRVKDDATVLLPDWKGNNRVDTLENIIRDPRVALMFLIPGSNSVIRINGRAVISVEPQLLESFVMDGKHPRSVVVTTIDEVYFQCARAVMRADLWNPQHFLPASELPTAGQMLKGAKADFDQESYDREWPERAKAMW